MNAAAATKQRLTSFGRQIARTSPLYSLISLAAAEDDEMIALVTEAPDDDGQAMLLLAAVHSILQQRECPLRDFYPTLGGTLEPTPQTWLEFRDFVFDHEHEIQRILQTKSVQTNEVQRAAVLYPTVAEIAYRTGSAIALVEVGCSAGLLLSLDRYSYRYKVGDRTEISAGFDTSPLRLHCDVPEDILVETLSESSIAARVGLDKDPLDCRQPEQLRWLEACVWADQPERITRLRQAVQAHNYDDIQLLKGDAVNNLTSALAVVPHEVPAVLITSWVLAYLSRARQLEFLTTLGEAAKAREIWWLANETYESCLSHFMPRCPALQYTRSGRCLLSLIHWRNQGRRIHLLGTTDVHGRTLQRVNRRVASPVHDQI